MLDHQQVTNYLEVMNYFKTLGVIAVSRENKLQMYKREDLDTVPGKYEVTERKCHDYPIEISKTIDGVKFFRAIKRTEAIERGFIQCCPYCGKKETAEAVAK